MVKYNKGKNNISYQLLSRFHWVLLNPKTKRGNFHESGSLIGRIERFKKKHSVSGNIRKVKFLKYLTNNKYENLFRLITLPVSEFNNVNKKTIRALKKYKLLGDADFYGELLDNIFSYDSWRKGDKFKRLFELMEIQVCPYCNLEEIYHHMDGLRNIIVTSLDHYYDKATHPYFSLTFSNLIPVCKNCNETFKGTKTFKPMSHLHPYVDNYNDYCIFKNTIVFDKQSDIEIEYCNVNIKSKNTNNDLGLKTRYNTTNNKKEALRIYYLHEEYPFSKKKELVETWNLTSIKDVEKRLCQRQLIPFEQNEIRSNQKGKLKRDLAIQYKIITLIK